jgi:hypothetical protein
MEDLSLVQSVALLGLATATFLVLGSAFYDVYVKPKLKSQRQ